MTWTIFKVQGGVFKVHMCALLYSAGLLEAEHGLSSKAAAGTALGSVFS